MFGQSGAGNNWAKGHYTEGNFLVIVADRQLVLADDDLQVVNGADQVPLSKSCNSHAIAVVDMTSSSERYLSMSSFLYLA